MSGTTITIALSNVQPILEGLLGREVTVAATGTMSSHPITYRGLVDNNDELVSVIGSDLSFAHRCGAALAMIPVGQADEAGDEPAEMLLDVYTEVANVLSRLVNEANHTRVRLDPNLDHEPETLQALVDSGTSLMTCSVTVEGYGAGQLGIWQASGS